MKTVETVGSVLALRTVQDLTLKLQCLQGLPAGSVLALCKRNVRTVQDLTLKFAEVVTLKLKRPQVKLMIFFLKAGTLS